MLALAVALLSGLSPGLALEPVADPAGCPASAWTGTWVDGTSLPDPAAVAALDAWAFPASVSPEDEAARRGVRTEGLLVIRDGAILYERYARGYTATTPHLTWSVSKTFTNTLVGIAIEQGALELDDGICEHIQVTNPANCAIKVRDLLAFGSGLAWRETYEGDPPTTSSVVAMLYGQGTHDMAAFISGAERRAEPSMAWQYSSGDTTLLAAVVGAALAGEHGSDYAWSLLFEPLGMENMVWERDDAGTLVGSSYVYGPPRELAKLGQLWLDDGCWEGRRMLPPRWVARSTQPSLPLQRLALDWEPEGVQGWQVWLNQPVPALGQTTNPWPSAPADMYAARGHWKQTIAVMPSLGAVVVRVGDDRDGESFSWDTLFRLTAAVVGGTPAATAPPPPVPLADAGTGQTGETAAMKFDTGLLRIGANYGARLACSCAFVMGQTEDYCRAWVKASPDIVKIRFDQEEKRVTATALGLVRSHARWYGAQEGCRLEP